MTISHFSSAMYRGGVPEVVSITGDTIAFDAGSPGLTATWVFKNDGTIERQGAPYGAGVQWLSTQPTPIGEYWMRATLSSGSAPNSGTLNTWQKIAGSGSVNAAYVWASNGFTDVNGSILVEISDDSAGSNILDAATFSVAINDI